MEPYQLIEYCPQCGQKNSAPKKIPFQCGHCGLEWFFNPSVSVCVFLFREDGQMLFVRRAKEPSQGMLGLPGGFVDMGETAEAALRREVREEVQLEITDITFLTTYTNRYTYQNVTYPVLDLFFTARAIHPEAAISGDDVSGVEWISLNDLRLEELAFDSIRLACKALQS